MGQNLSQHITTGADYNTFIGYQSGSDITTGADNILIGPEVNTGGTHLKTGSNDILIGYNANTPATTGQQFTQHRRHTVRNVARNNVGNIIFGFNCRNDRHRHHHSLLPPRLGSDTAASSTSPSPSSTAPRPPSSPSSTPATPSRRHAHPKLRPAPQDQHPIARRLILALAHRRPQSRHLQLDRSEQGTTPQLGFIAQQVQQIFPQPRLDHDRRPRSRPTARSSLNYIGLISPIVSAIQALDQRTSPRIENTIAGFAQSLHDRQLLTRRNVQSQRTLRRLNLRHARAIPGDGRRRKRLAIIGAGKRRAASIRRCSKRPTPRPSSKSTATTPPSSKSAPPTTTSAPPSPARSRPQPRHQDIRERRRNEPRPDRHQQPQPTRSTTSPPTKTASRPPAPAPSSSKPQRTTTKPQPHPPTTTPRHRPQPHVRHVNCPMTEPLTIDDLTYIPISDAAVAHASQPNIWRALRANTASAPE